MEYIKRQELKQIEDGKKDEQATLKQIQFVEILANRLGFYVNTQNMTKYEAAEKIEQFKKIMQNDKQKKIRENDIKLGMAKKLVFQKWTTESRKIDKQTENVFIREVIYINDVLNRIDIEILSKQAA
jgi:hypothetical protein